MTTQVINNLIYHQPIQSQVSISSRCLQVAKTTGQIGLSIGKGCLAIAKFGLTIGRFIKKYERSVYKIITVGLIIQWNFPTLLKMSGYHPIFDSAPGPVARFSNSEFPSILDLQSLKVPQPQCSLLEEVSDKTILGQSELIEVLCDNKESKSLLEKGLRQLVGCPQALDFVRSVLSQKGSIKIRCLTQPEGSINEAGIKLKERELIIGTKIPHKIPLLISVELNNLKYEGRAKSVNPCELDKIGFGIAIERIEYTTQKEVNDLLNECIDKTLLPLNANPFNNSFSNQWRNFEGYLHEQRATGHTEGYEKQRDRLCMSRIVSALADAIEKK